MPIYKMEGLRNKKQKYRVCVNFKDHHGEYRQIQRIAYGLTDVKFHLRTRADMPLLRTECGTCRSTCY